MTAEEFWDWWCRPENQDHACELVDGEVVDVVPPRGPHGVICAWIAHLLWSVVVRSGRGYVCGNNTALLLQRDPDTVLGPDVMLFAESRTLDQLSRRFAQGVPRLTVEVLSPHDQAARVNLRVAQYLRRGVPLVWVMEPETRTVAVYRPGQIHQVLDDTEEVTGGDVLPEVRLPVAELFALPGA